MVCSHPSALSLACLTRKPLQGWAFHPENIWKGASHRSAGPLVDLEATGPT